MSPGTSEELTESVRTVARHEVDKDFAEERAAESAEELPEYVTLVKRKPSALRTLMKLSLEDAGLRCATDPEAAWVDTWDSFVLATQAGSAVFTVASQDDGEVEFRLEDEVVHVTATGPTMQSDALTWLDALYLAMIFRDRNRIDFLASVPVDLLRAAGLDYDEYVYAVVRMWQGYWTGAENLVELTLEAMRAADPELVVNSSSRVVLQVYFPIVEAFYQFILRDEEKFNEALGNAVALHREFWTKDESSAVDPRGYVALGLLALACTARDSGLSIDVSSEYLPDVLLEGGRVGERSF